MCTDWVFLFILLRLDADQAESLLVEVLPTIPPSNSYPVNGMHLPQRPPALPHRVPVRLVPEDPAADGDSRAQLNRRHQPPDGLPADCVLVPGNQLLLQHRPGGGLESDLSGYGPSWNEAV